MDVRMFTVGPVAENTYIFRRDGSDRALIVDPGDEADKLLDAIRELGVRLEGILLTHTHFEHTLSGGERLELAGFEIDVVFTPGHSPGHVTFSIPDEQAIFSGDVLFQGSVGRVDLPGGDWGTLLESIRTLVDTLPAETAVYPGHMGITSLGAERASNPFLAELAR